MDTGNAFRQQAAACADLGSPMYAALLGRVADAVTGGGAEAAPFAAVLQGHEDDPGPAALALRLAGSVHRLVLERRAGLLGTYYPSVGGRWEPEGGWAAFRSLIVDQPEAVREWLDRPPQTNEVGRGAALMAGLLELVRTTPLPIRLLEIGSSGGLTLHADRFAFADDVGRVHGDSHSPVQLAGAWTGPGPWADPNLLWPTVIERVGTDVRPVDVTTTAGRLTLTAYVWPDMTARHERLRGALQLAAGSPVPVRQQSARDAVENLALIAGTTTVLWHSVMWQYLDSTEQRVVLDRLEELGATATENAPLAHLSLEPRRRRPDENHQFWLTLRTWPGGATRFLARARPHGVPIDWQ